MTQPESKKYRDLLLQIYEQFERQCPLTLRQRIRKFPSDPGNTPLQKRETDVDKWRIRLLPIDRTPTGFWDDEGCFYEIGVGFLGEPFRQGVGNVQFFFKPGPDSKIRSRYSEAVQSAIGGVASSTKFQLKTRPNRRGAIYQYLAAVYSEEPSMLNNAPKDLIELIELTLPRLTSIRQP